MNILMVLTSHDELGETGEKTGFWLEEFAAPYYAFKDGGAKLTLASPKGGQPPLDPKSDDESAQTEDTRRFKSDEDAQKALANTVKLDTVNSEDFDAVFYPGGHGPLWDLTNDEHSVALIESFWKADKPIGAVCHAPTVLLNVKDEHGHALVKGRKVTGFTNSEEEAVGLTQVVPHRLEDALKELGGDYHKGDDWAPFAVSDHRLITGQNPASSKPVAEALMAQLKIG
jgi:putative intracellular protease/amidase